MRIAFLIRALDYGGSEIQLMNLARGLRQRGHDILVTCLYPGGRLGEAYDDASIPMTHLGKKRRWEIVGPTAKLIRTLRRWSPDVVHGYLSAGNLLSLTAWPGRRAAIVWGLRASDLDLRPYGWWLRASARTERLLARFADRIVVNSAAARQHAASTGFPPGKLELIPNGIDTERFRRDPEGGRRLRERWGVNGEEKLVGLVGRLDPVKGHSVFLRAAALLVARREDVRFVCVGDGPPEYASRVRSEAIDLGLGDRVGWAPSRADVQAVYSAVDLLCCASHSESFPNVVAEAMACETRCVVTDVGDAARIVADTGRVVPPGDPARLAQAIEESLDRREEETASLRRRRRIVEEFGLEQLVERTETLLRAAVEERRR